MAKYINTDLLEAVGFTDQEGSFSDGVQWLLEYIDALPSEEVQPVRHGRWVKNETLINCSVCKHCSWSIIPYEDLVKSFNYCPRCGADMRGEQNG